MSTLCVFFEGWCRANARMVSAACILAKLYALHDVVSSLSSTSMAQKLAVSNTGALRTFKGSCQCLCKPCVCDLFDISFGHNGFRVHYLNG